MVPVVLLLALAGRPDDPSGNDLFKFDPGDVIETYDTARFEVHYTRAGKNAVPLADADADGVPDHVQDVGALYEQVLDTYTGLGYRAPLGDGDGRFDVYLVDTGLSADGSFVAETCDANNHCSGYMVEENDFAGFPYPSLEYADRLLASHEFFHAVQAAYDASQGSVIAEGTAVWASEHFDSTLDDLEQFSSSYVDDTDRPLTSDGAGPVDSFTYGTSIWWEYLSEHLGVDVIRAMWEACDGPSDAHWDTLIDGVLTDAGATGFADVFTEFAAATLSLGSRGNPAHGFAEASALPDLKLKSEDLPVVDESFIVFIASYVTLAVQPGERDTIRAVVAGDPKNTDGVRLALIPITGTSVGDVVTGSLDLSIDKGDADTIAVQIVNTHLSGDGARPHVCIGSSDEVDACLASFNPAPPVRTPPAKKTAPPGGCSSSSAPTWLSVGALLLVVRSGRRRRR